MLLEALGVRLMHLDPLMLFRCLLVFAGVVGLAASLLPAVVISLMERTRRAKAILRGAITEEARALIDKWELRARRAEAECKELRAWKAKAVGTLQEARNHNRNQNADATALIAEGGKG